MTSTPETPASASTRPASTRPASTRPSAARAGRRPALRLPGQAAAPEGPCDLSGMYLMHHGFRRDLARFVAAAARTPIDDRPTWVALRDRWDRMAHLLHDHHTKEDLVLWPLLLERADAADDGEARTVLAAMEEEHDQIDPLLERVRAGFARLAVATDEPALSTQRADLARARAVLDAHLGHEESAAVAVMQRHVGGEEWAALERAVFRSRPSPRALWFQLPWMVAGLDDALVAPLLDDAGAPFRVILRLARPSFGRLDRAAFAHVPVGVGA